jgi:parallel beta-helix repeat protein
MSTVVSSSLTPMDPLNVTGNKGFESGAWSGSGSASDPYVLTAMNISFPGTCLRITNTTAHFEITDSFVSAVQWNILDSLIMLTNCSNGLIRDCELKYAFAQVHMHRCANITIAGCHFRRFTTGSFGQYLEDITLFNNTFSEGGSAGINLIDVEDVLVDSNTMQYSGPSIVSVYRSLNLFIRRNIIVTAGSPNMGIGMEISKADDCILSDNQIMGAFQYGLQCTGSGGLMIGNAIDGPSTAFQLKGSEWNITGNVFQGGFQGLELTSCDSVSVLENQFSEMQGSACVVRGGLHNNVSDCEMFDCVTGVLLQATMSATVKGNLFTRCPYAITLSGTGLGFYFPDGPPRDCQLCDNTLIESGFYFSAMEEVGYRHTVHNNTVNGRPFGYFYNQTGDAIELWQYGQVVVSHSRDCAFRGGNLVETSDALTILFSNNCSVRQLAIYNCSRGIRLLNSERISIIHTSVIDLNPLLGTVSPFAVDMRHSDGCFVDDCILTDGAIGIYQTDCSNTTIDDCQISHNGYGIFLFDSDHNHIVRNSIVENTDVGISIDSRSTDNRIYGNEFLFNGMNAQCGSSQNYWDDGLAVGNTWSDYFGNGSYYIPEYGEDHYPSRWPTNSTTTHTTTPPVTSQDYVVEVAMLIFAASLISLVIAIQEIKLR